MNNNLNTNEYNYIKKAHIKPSTTHCAKHCNQFGTPYMSFPSEAERYIEAVLSEKPLMYFPKTSEEVELNNKLEEGDFDKVDLIELFSNDDYQSIDSMLVGCSKTKDVKTFNTILSIANYELDKCNGYILKTDKSVDYFTKCLDNIRTSENKPFDIEKSTKLDYLYFKNKGLCMKYLIKRAIITANMDLTTFYESVKNYYKHPNADIRATYCGTITPFNSNNDTNEKVKKVYNFMDKYTDYIIHPDNRIKCEFIDTKLTNNDLLINSYSGRICDASKNRMIKDYDKLDTELLNYVYDNKARAYYITKLIDDGIITKTNNFDYEFNKYKNDINYSNNKVLTKKK